MTARRPNRMPAVASLLVNAPLMLIIASACSLPPGTGSPSSTSTTASAKEFFSGTLAVQGSSIATFEVVQAGTVTVTITSLGAPTGTVVGLGLGVLSATGACNFSSSNPAAVTAVTPQINATESAGQYCVEIYDVGALAGPVAFGITIQHS
jgi:hypothetical protein